MSPRKELLDDITDAVSEDAQYGNPSSMYGIIRKCKKWNMNDIRKAVRYLVDDKQLEEIAPNIFELSK